MISWSAYKALQYATPSIDFTPSKLYRSKIDNINSYSNKLISEF